MFLLLLLPLLLLLLLLLLLSVMLPLPQLLEVLLPQLLLPSTKFFSIKVANSTEVATSNQTTGCATQSDCLPVHCSNCFCSEGSFSVSFSGLATLIPPTSIPGETRKTRYLEMHNFNNFCFVKIVYTLVGIFIERCNEINYILSK